MIVSFAWTAAALLEGRKTQTRRAWSDAYAARFHKGDLVDAWDKSPRAGGQKIGVIELLEEPRKARLDAVTPAELEAEGGLWSSRSAWLEAWAEKGLEGDREVWILEFRLVDTVPLVRPAADDQRAPIPPGKG